MNPWIEHVKKCQVKHNCSYKEAMIKAKKTYKSKKTNPKKQNQKLNKKEVV
jgi:hypothetical protein